MTERPEPQLVTTAAAIPGAPLWELQKHSAAKHQILKYYLDAWYPIVGRFPGRVVFVDGFCGPGAYSEGQDGSPIIALNALIRRPNFTTLESDFEFHFIDKDEAAIGYLRESAVPSKVGVLPANVRVEYACGVFDASMPALLATITAPRTPTRSFVMVDPFGWSDTPLATIASILACERTEVLVTLMLDSLNRWVTAEDTAKDAHYDALFGTPDWRQIGLGNNRIPRMRELYRQQLLRHAKYVRPFKLTSEGKRSVYDLFFATNSIEGLSRMKDAMWRVDPDYGAGFDAAHAQSGTLFGADYSALDDQIVREFGSLPSVTIEQVEEFTIVSTDFRKAHLRSRLKVLENTGRLTWLGFPKSHERYGTARRRGTFPAEGMVAISA